MSTLLPPTAHRCDRSTTHYSDACTYTRNIQQDRRNTRLPVDAPILFALPECTMSPVGRIGVLPKGNLSPRNEYFPHATLSPSRNHA